eukprot:TRINITY_DN2105_c0_g1_i2.p1 TRINITY_DN2105_c0_g1~~TRINITY_DN2105_c0_g1_i2.p1  ORF type:complete len:137 (+),score=18.03 TRINITY_DN2105_c0_g1_i2:333-743(+)
MIANDISPMLGVDYLSTSESAKYEWPLQGIIFGTNQRLFINLPVSFKNNAINVTFLVDTGSPHTYICFHALTKVLGAETTRAKFKMYINGVVTDVNESPLDSHFFDMNVLGGNYFAKIRAVLSVDYDEQTLTLAGK